MSAMPSVPHERHDCECRGLEDDALEDLFDLDFRYFHGVKLMIKTSLDSPTERIITQSITSERITSERIITERITS